MVKPKIQVGRLTLLLNKESSTNITLVLPIYTIDVWWREWTISHQHLPSENSNIDLIMEYKYKWILQFWCPGKSESTIKHESEEFIMDIAH